MESTQPEETLNSYDAYMGEIQIVAFNFAPQGWALCDGRLLQVKQYAALFSLLGTNYGGDGENTFALPDMRGRVPLCFGQGPTLTPQKLGESTGSESVSLSISEMPSHTHQYNAANNAVRASTNPDGLMLGFTAGAFYTTLPGPTVTNKLLPMNPQINSTTGNSQPHGNMQPSLSLNFIICINGIYPSRP